MDVKNLKITSVEQNDVIVYSVFIDNTHNAGILRCTNEIQLEFTIDADGNAKIHSGWEIGVGGDWTWEPGEEDSMEQTHPGLLVKLAEAVKEMEKAA